MALHLRWMSPFLRQLEAKSLAAWQQWSNRKSTKRQIPNNKLDLTIVQHYLCKKSAVVALKSVWRIPEDSRVWSATANTTSVRIAKLGKGQAATQASAKAKRQAHKGSERKGHLGYQASKWIHAVKEHKFRLRLGWLPRKHTLGATALYWLRGPWMVSSTYLQRNNRCWEFCMI